MVEKIDGFSKASKIFETERGSLIDEKKYEDVGELLKFSKDLASRTSVICPAYPSGIIALGITDLIAAKVENPDNVFKKMIAFFKKSEIITNVQTESLRYKSAVCLSIYLQKQIDVQ